MKIALLYPSLFVASVVCVTSSTALDDASLVFPDQKIELPALSLAAAAKENLSPVFKSAPFAIIPRSVRTEPGPKLNDDKFVIQPDKSVDYKLTIKAPDASVDYRLIVKNPDEGSKK